MGRRYKQLRKYNWQGEGKALPIILSSQMQISPVFIQYSNQSWRAREHIHSVSVIKGMRAQAHMYTLHPSTPLPT